MARLGMMLDLARCPHCGVDNPNLAHLQNYETADYQKQNKRFWRAYKCGRCGGVVTASARGWDAEVEECFPSTSGVDESLPLRAREYLEQALNSLHVPAGAVMLSASAVDAMLKAKGLIEGNLYTRIDAAARDGTITTEMAAWAHDVRLDANDQRHADEGAALPSTSDAKRCVEFAQALAQFMFVLPARVARGRASAKGGG